MRSQRHEVQTGSLWSRFKNTAFQSYTGQPTQKNPNRKGDFASCEKLNGHLHNTHNTIGSAWLLAMGPGAQLAAAGPHHYSRSELHWEKKKTVTLPSNIQKHSSNVLAVAKPLTYTMIYYTHILCLFVQVGILLYSQQTYITNWLHRAGLPLKSLFLLILPGYLVVLRHKKVLIEARYWTVPWAALTQISAQHLIYVSEDPF
jgi:hypothetical protein